MAHTVRTVLASVLLFATLSGCAQQTIYQRPSTTYRSERLRTCTFIFDIEDLADCKFLAETGDMEAAIKVAKSYARTRNRWYDEKKSFRWYKVAADAGHQVALKKVFNTYSSGYGAVPENSIKADEYLHRAVTADAEWAQLVLARRLEKSDPQKAMSLYLKAARRNNCHAQGLLAKAYYTGDITDKNLTQSYFWALLASTGGRNRRSPPAGPVFASNDSCRMRSGVFPTKFRLKRELPKKFMDIAESAAASWLKGQTEVMLTSPLKQLPPPYTKRTPKAPITAPSTSASKPTPKISSPKIASVSPTRIKPKQRLLALPEWTPIGADQRPTFTIAPKKTTDLFKLVSRSVWSVFATRSIRDLKRRKNISQGSAVAVTKSKLLTNCHVVESRPFVFVKQGEAIFQAKTQSGDEATDRCILSVKEEIFTPVVGVRAFDSLEVGEDVFTIGSPSGLERTLGSGIISGLRTLKGERFVQTDAPISPGSSGGGLFDRSGNLIGITTFKVREGENINFAIAAEEFFR